MKKILILFIGISFLSFTDHKYYLALTEIEHNTNSNSIQMIMNVFMDDIEVAINKEQVTDLRLTTKDEPKNVDEYFFNYLKDKFKVTINNSKANFKFIGKEYQDNIVYFYLEIENVTKVNSLEIENNVLIAHFPDQQNLIKAKINNTKKSLFLTKENNKGLLNY
ncbi:hypothetical protein EV195_109102 [Tenacibaculum skagerrakense]|uniref:Peptidase E n=1 Tax=Tenacibaculum skagerrakense TaxID=186571 RepID=A0A4V2SLG7_9FLAO|nr:DUF6702 family protein [Tenacibaculum skagerrakense]TCP23376.1 hypothetical protein EV195_109102 [Tenacibaculum skagerrakense]